ncbi:MAG TPA: cytochrome c [Rubrivivax sp.]|nr:cytochrome c [Rubrivivax sp.]
MKRLSLVALAAAAIVITLPAAAQFAKPEEAVKYRQSALTVMGTHFGRVGAMVQGKAPFDAAAAQADIEIATMMSTLPFTAFGPGTDVGKTGAKRVIWTERAKFDAAAKKMQDEMVKLNAAAKTGNLEQIKTAFGPTAAACKACHDDFRNR